MATKNINILNTKVLGAAKKARESIGDAGSQKGDVALTGKTRKNVLAHALAAMSDEERDYLRNASDTEAHAFIGGVLAHAGCLLDTPQGYLATIKDAVGVANAAPSMPGPANVRKAIDRLNKVEEPKQPKAKRSPPKKVKKTSGGDLASLTKKELLNRAKEANVEGVSAKTTKAELIAALS